MMTKKYTFDSIPSLVENEGKTILVRFGAEERKVEVSDNENGMQAASSASSAEGKAKSASQTKTVYDCYSIRINQPLSRDKIVDAIITGVYPTDKMQAIINNHFAILAKRADGKELDADDEEHEAEYEAMQEWRTKAKEVAKQVIAEYTSRFC